MNFVMIESSPAKPEDMLVVSGQAEAPAKHQLPVLARLNRIKAQAESKPINRRVSNRRPMKLDGAITVDSSNWIDCTVLDMSAGGAQLEIHSEGLRSHGRDPVPERFFLVIDNLLERVVVECYVRWRNGLRAGVLFLGPIDATMKKLPVRAAKKHAAVKRR